MRGQCEEWAWEYGVAYEVPTTLSERKIKLGDPRALAHFCSKETWTYVPTDFGLLFIRKNVRIVWKFPSIVGLVRKGDTVRTGRGPQETTQVLVASL